MRLPWTACAGMGQLCTQLSLDTPMLILTEEGLADGAESLNACLDHQPAWSDLPLLLLSAAGQRRGRQARWGLFEKLGNVTLLDRPAHIGALKGAVRAALRGRRRQYQARSYLEQLESARSDLERRISERTHQLEEEMAERQHVEAALSRAQRLEAIGQLTGGVAHDFNNLLQVVMGGISVLERHGANPDRRTTVLEAMRQAAERGAKLTQQLLAFARRQPLAPEPVDVGLRIEDMQELLRGSLRADLTLHLRLAPDLWPVKTDVTQFEVAVLNLVINARDATDPSGEISISAENISLLPERPIEGLVGDFVRITVSDNGSGMDEEMLRRAVEPFFTTKPPGRGTGLGLSQVHGFARQSGGAIHMESAPGRGTSVCVFLPHSSEPPVKIDEPVRTAFGHNGGRVLVVEDEDRVADLACEMLHDLGYHCGRAVSGDEALRMDISTFEAVLSDVVMPGKLDGIALAQELRRRHPRLPILLTTGFAGAPERIADAGFPVLTKPYNFEQLSEAFGALMLTSR